MGQTEFAREDETMRSVKRRKAEPLVLGKEKRRRLIREQRGQRAGDRPWPNGGIRIWIE